MTAEQLEELLWNVTQGATMNVRTMARAELNILAPSLASRVIAAEEMKDAFVEYLGSDDFNGKMAAIFRVNSALNAYREVSKG